MPTAMHKCLDGVTKAACCVSICSHRSTRLLKVAETAVDARAIYVFLMMVRLDFSHIERTFRVNYGGLC